MEFINVDDFREALYHEAFETDSDMVKWDSGCWIRYKMVENAIKKAAIIEGETIRHGHWIKLDTCEYRCSECGKIQYGDAFSDLHYCCNCGSKNEVLAVDMR